jgi:hypothetical protein
MSTVILAPHHAEMLRQSAIGADVIAARGYRTVTDKNELTRLGFSPAQAGTVPGLLLPVHTTDGGNGVYAFRPDKPRIFQTKTESRAAKYEIPKNGGVRLDCPPACQPALADPKVPLWITEGQKKADALASVHLCAIDLLGVWMFKGKNEFGGTTLLADFDCIAWNGRDVRIVFDSDVMTKPPVRQAIDRLTEHLQRWGAHVTAVYLPGGPKGKIGVDDWLAAGHSVDELEALIEAPRPEPKAAAPWVELLDAAPLIIRRPLALLDGHAYAAAWLYVQVTVTETVNKKGEVVKIDPPEVTKEQRLFIVRDDGTVFGAGGNEDIDALGLDVKLPEIPQPDKTWSKAGVVAYRSGQRPAPADIFSRVADVVDRFIDFDRSLGSQRTMAELVACYILATYFLDAFNVIGFLWPNGDRGSGKTQLLTVICELAYLGQVILAGGSYASLRDMADYGATLAFDDAEGLSDPKRTDPDKRALLLAGNRRGNTVPVKELAGDKTWRTRHVNTFCPRLFSAIQLPDAILASRTVIVPLIRTPDRYRANADPLEYKLWPHDRRQLIDDLWALALEHLAGLPVYEAKVNDRATLAGRALEPWRALLSVALWLNENGAAGLWDRMAALSESYQTERPDLETSDLTAVVIRALTDCAVANVTNGANVTNAKGDTPTWDFTTSQVTEAAKAIANDSEGQIDANEISSQRLGHVLRKMRLPKPSRPRGKGARIWRVTLTDLEKWTTAYGLPMPAELQREADPSPDIGNIGNIGNIGDSTPSVANGADDGTDEDLSGEAPEAPPPPDDGPAAEYWGWPPLGASHA